MRRRKQTKSEVSAPVLHDPDVNRAPDEHSPATGNELTNTQHASLRDRMREVVQTLIASAAEDLLRRRISDRNLSHHARAAHRQALNAKGYQATEQQLERSIGGLVANQSSDATDYFLREAPAKLLSAFAQLIVEAEMYAAFAAASSSKREQFPTRVQRIVRSLERQRLVNVDWPGDGHSARSRAAAFLRLTREGEAVFKRHAVLRKDIATEDEADSLIRETPEFMAIPSHRRQIVIDLLRWRRDQRYQDGTPSSLARVFAATALSGGREVVSASTALRQHRAAVRLQKTSPAVRHAGPTFR